MSFFFFTAVRLKLLEKKTRHEKHIRKAKKKKAGRLHKK
jgi:hypothetical protein